MNDKENIVTKCNCGCTYVEVKNIPEANLYFLSFYRDGNGNYLSWKRKFEEIKNILFNRHIFIQEIVLSKIDLEEFGTNILNIANNKEEK